MCFVLTSDEKEERVYGFEHRLQLRSATKALITDEKIFQLGSALMLTFSLSDVTKLFLKKVIVQPEYEPPLKMYEKESQYARTGIYGKVFGVFWFNRSL